MSEHLTGLAEAERQHRVAQRLFEAIHGPVANWKKIRLEKRRPFIDQAAKPPYSDTMD